MIWTPQDVQERLEEAGATLFALPSGGVWPAGYRSFWPAVAEVAEDNGWNETIYRLPVPSAAAISRMDEVDRWISTLVPDDLGRRVLRAHSFVNPRSGHPIFSWKQIAVLIHKNEDAVRMIYARRLFHLSERLNERAAFRMAA